MRIVRCLLAVGAVVGLLAGSPLSRAANADAVSHRLHVTTAQRPAYDAIERLNRQWIDAYTQGNLERFMACYTDDAMLALAGGRALVGKDAIRAFFAPRLTDVSARHVDVVFRYEKVRIERDLAYLVTLNWITLDTPEHASTRSGARSILVYRRVPGRGWLMDVDIEQRTQDADVAELPVSDLSAKPYAGRGPDDGTAACPDALVAEGSAIRGSGCPVTGFRPGVVSR